jgi:hypothetical protein
MTDAPRIAADSQFNYPGRKDGWRYRYLDSADRLGDLVTPARSKDTVTPLAYLVCPDARCIIGRDFLHPGKEARPCLQWDAPAAGSYLLKGEVAIARGEAAGPLSVTAVLDDLQLFTVKIGFPDVLNIAIPLDLKSTASLRLIFDKITGIDNLFTLFYVEILAASREVLDHMIPRKEDGSPEYLRLERDPSWDALKRELDKITFGCLSGEDLHLLARNPFVPNGALLRNAERLADAIQHMQHSPGAPKFREPRFFSVRKPRHTEA